MHEPSQHQQDQSVSSHPLQLEEEGRSGTFLTPPPFSVTAGGPPPVQRQALGDAQGPIQRRVPTHASLSDMLKNPELGISEDVLRDRLTVVLQRMRLEGRLESTDPVPEIVVRILPGGGVVDEAAFNDAVAENDRTIVYENAAEAEAPIAAGDRPGFRQALARAVGIIDQARADNSQLDLVFGSSASTAAGVYENARNYLQNLIDSDTALNDTVHTDYNRDDREVGLGGYAVYGRVMHLMPSVVQGGGAISNDDLVTLIHEAAHMADGGVTDRGYYPPGTAQDVFAAYSEAFKVTNAAHFEEIPRRILGTSVYANDFRFVPDTSSPASGGGTLSDEDRARGQLTEYFRRAWTHALRMHIRLRQLRVALQNGDRSAWSDNQARLLEISRQMQLTLHEQTGAQPSITDMDLVISEGIVRNCSFLMGYASAEPVPAIGPDRSLDEAVQEMITSVLGRLNVVGDGSSDAAFATFLQNNSNF